MSIALIRADWSAPTGVVAACTTRGGGVSEGNYASLNLASHVGDRNEHVNANRRCLTERCKLPEEPRWLSQTHGTDVIDAEDSAFATGPPDADAVVSRHANQVIAVLTADCLPLLLCSRQGDEVAAVHCGWRSLLGGIVLHTAKRMSARPEDVLAWLGPAISQPAFEVGDEVRDRFLAGVECAASCFEPNDNGRWQADLSALARCYLEAAGIVEIYGGGLCTYADPQRFFSYRRDGRCGRMASFIYLRS